MNWIISEQMSKTGKYNAGSKAREDVEQILLKKGFKRLYLSCTTDNQSKRRIRKALSLLAKRYTVQKELKSAVAGDTVLFQMPTNSHLFYMASLIKHLKRRGVKTVALIHDVESLRFGNSRERSKWYKIRVKLEERALKCFDSVIAHNSKMSEFLVANKGVRRDRVRDLEIFDYLAAGDMAQEMLFPCKGEWKIAVAGNLAPHKSPYLQQLPEKPDFNLYGIGFEGNGKENIKYFGAFLPGELPEKLEAHFGLVWDGTTTKTCDGVTGRYLKYNNPHKTSLYLCAGIPVIIWKDAAMAKFVAETECGIAVGSLTDLADALRKVDSAYYIQMRNNAKKIGAKLRSGFYTLKAIE